MDSNRSSSKTHFFHVFFFFFFRRCHGQIAFYTNFISRIGRVRINGTYPTYAAGQAKRLLCQYPSLAFSSFFLLCFYFILPFCVTFMHHRTIVFSVYHWHRHLYVLNSSSVPRRMHVRYTRSTFIRYQNSLISNYRSEFNDSRNCS